MAKKKPPRKNDDETTAGSWGASPKFGGFNALAAGLGDLKAKLDEEKKREEAEAARRKAEGKKPPPAPAPAVKVPPRPKASAEDELTFHRMMSGVTPLDSRASRVAVAGGARVEATRMKPAEVKERAQKEAAAVLEHLHQLVDDGVRFEVTDDGRRVEGRRSDVPPSVVRQLRRGMLPIDGRLDLHGLDAKEAEAKVGEFLRTMRTRRERCVLVIHGKGAGSPGGGVLRGEISAWLSQGRAREHVAAFATANPEDGGEGALYIALRP
jgi:DNA-nicking Smr family endonuclease